MGLAGNRQRQAIRIPGEKVGGNELSRNPARLNLVLIGCIFGREEVQNWQFFCALSRTTLFVHSCSEFEGYEFTIIKHDFLGYSLATRNVSPHSPFPFVLEIHFHYIHHSSYDSNMLDANVESFLSCVAEYRVLSTLGLYVDILTSHAHDTKFCISGIVIV